MEEIRLVHTTELSIRRVGIEMLLLEVRKLTLGTFSIDVFSTFSASAPFPPHFSRLGSSLCGLADIVSDLVVLAGRGFTRSFHRLKLLKQPFLLKVNRFEGLLALSNLRLGL